MRRPRQRLVLAAVDIQKVASMGDQASLLPAQPDCERPVANELIRRIQADGRAGLLGDATGDGFPQPHACGTQPERSDRR